MSDDSVDEVSARLHSDGRVHLKWKYADSPYMYRWFNFNR